MVFVLGIDIGSASSKGIVLGDQGPLGSFDCPSGGDFKLAADRSKRGVGFSDPDLSRGYFPDGRHRIWIKIGGLRRRDKIGYRLPWKGRFFSSPLCEDRH